MRVTFVLPDVNLGGGTRVIAQHADNLRRRGHSIFIVSTPPWDFRVRHKISIVLRGEKWPKARKRLPSHLDGLGLEHCVLSRRRPVRDGDVPDADVVVATWWETADGVARLSPQKGAKAYFIQHFEANLDQPQEPVMRTWRLPIQKITCAQWLGDLARDRFDDPTAIVVPNGLDTALFDAPERGRQSRPTVGMMYSPAPAKGWDTGLKALVLARRSVPDLRLRVFGSAELEGSLPIDAEYTRVPPQAQIREIYSSCDLWFCSSRSEGYHLPPLEAMGCRCPVVSTRVGGPQDMIIDGVNGYVVNVDDVAALADRIVRVLGLPEPTWKMLSDAAYARAREYTTWDATEAFEQALFATIERERSAGRAVVTSGVSH
jgi:glycosyltransferase involved in cell wall biosynthesis